MRYDCLGKKPTKNNNKKTAWMRPDTGHLDMGRPNMGWLVMGHPDMGVRIWESGYGRQDMGIRIWASGYGTSG